jgi:hypothetical protein
MIDAMPEMIFLLRLIVLLLGAQFLLALVVIVGSLINRRAVVPVRLKVSLEEDS